MQRQTIDQYGYCCDVATCFDEATVGLYSPDGGRVAMCQDHAEIFQDAVADLFSTGEFKGHSIVRQG